MVHVADLAHARAQELQSLLNELGHRQDKHRTALQILPRYMRRRAASYNIKRLPRSLRSLADPKTVNFNRFLRSNHHFDFPGHGKNETSITSLSSTTTKFACCIYQSSTKNQMVANTHLACQTFSHGYIVELSSSRKIQYEMHSTDV